MTTTPNSKAGQLTEKIMRIFWDDGIPLETKDYNRAWSHVLLTLQKEISDDTAKGS